MMNNAERKVSECRRKGHRHNRNAPTEAALVRELSNGE